MISLGIHTLATARADELELVASLRSSTARRTLASTTATRRLWFLPAHEAEFGRVGRDTDVQCLDRVSLWCSARAIVGGAGAVGSDDVFLGIAW